MGLPDNATCRGSLRGRAGLGMQTAIPVAPCRSHHTFPSSDWNCLSLAHVIFMFESGWGGGIDIGPSLVLPVDSATVAFAANGVLNTKPGGKSCLSGLRSRTLFGLRHWLCKLLFYSDSSNCFPWLYLCCVNSLSRSIHPNNNSNRL